MPPEPESAGVPRVLGPAALLLSASTLALQVALVRVLSVALWYSFAFLVVSTAILGVGISGMVLALWPRLLAGDVRRRLSGLAGAFGASVVASYALARVIPFEPFRLAVSPVQAVLAPVYLVTLLVPFVLSGLALGILFTRFARVAPRLYAFDLAGAGIGAVAVVFAFAPLGGSGTVVLTAVGGLAAAALLAPTPARRAGAGALALAALGLAVGAGRLLPVRITPDKTTARGVPIARVVASRAEVARRWNALSRLDLINVDGRRFILIDGGVALTRLPRIPRAGLPRPPLDAMTTLAFRLHPGTPALVLGSGGGFEVYGALTRGSPSVTAVEVNPGIVDWDRHLEAGYLHHLFADRRVQLVEDEARSFLRRSRRRYGVIVLAHTISNAATAAGALDLAESYTLTVQGIGDAVDHLAPGGILYVTRPEVQLGKLVRTALAVLRARGTLDPARCLIALRRPPLPGRRMSFTAGLMIRARPFDEATVAAAREAIASEGLEALYLPGDPGTGPDAALVEGRLPRARLRAAALVPATDDRPFFNERRRFTSLGLADIARVLSAGRGGRLALEDAPVSEVSVLLLLLLAVGIAAGLTALPLVATRRRGTAVPGRARVLGYFVALGLGYLFVELGLVHALTLFIGPPTVTFAVVLGGLLLASGLGARLAEGRRLSPRVALIAVAAVAGFAVVAPLVTRLCLGWPLPARAATALILVAPVGVALGMPFPLGLRRCGVRAPSLLPLAWGVSGFASVVASAASVVIASALGFTAVLVAGALAYLGAAAFLRGGRLGAGG